MSNRTRVFLSALVLLMMLLIACITKPGTTPAPTATPTTAAQNPTATATLVSATATPSPTKVVASPTATTVPTITPAVFSQPPLPGGGSSAPVQTIVDDACASLVVNTMTTLEAACGNLSGSSVCFGHAPIAVYAAPDISFSKTGDIVPLEMINTIRTGPANVPANEWGTALVRIQPDQAAPEDYALITMVGDVTLHKATSDGRSLILQTGDAQPTCPGTPNSAIIQTPSGITVTLTINGVDLEMNGAVVVIRATPNGEMWVMVLSGTVIVTAQGGSQTVIIGQMTIILLGGDIGLIAIGLPAFPIAFDFSLIRFIPFYVGVDLVTIPANQRWTPTNIQLQAGQSFIVIASGLVKTIDYMPWSSPAGHPPSDCAAAGRTDWGDCKCRTLPEWGTCSLDGFATMALVARVGEGAPLLIGSGGVFTARNSGVLQLGPNDNTFEDNVGAFRAIVVAVNLGQ